MKTVKNTLNIGKKAGLDSIPGPRGLPVIGVLPHYAWNHGSYFSLEVGATYSLSYFSFEIKKIEVEK